MQSRITANTETFHAVKTKIMNLNAEYGQPDFHFPFLDIAKSSIFLEICYLATIEPIWDSLTHPMSVIVFTQILTWISRGLSKFNGFAYKMEGTSGMVLKFSIITSIFSVLRIWIGGRCVQRGRQIDLRFNSDMKLH